MKLRLEYRVWEGGQGNIINNLDDLSSLNYKNKKIKKNYKNKNKKTNHQKNFMAVVVL